MSKNTCLSIFLLYTVISLLLAVLSLTTDAVNIAFDYNEYFTIDSFFPYAVLVAGLMLAFLHGYVSKKVRINAIVNHKKKIKIYSSNATILIFLALQLLIIIYYGHKLYLAHSGAVNYLSTDDARIVGGKESYILLLLQSIIPIVVWRVYFLRMASIFVCTAIGFIFSWIDASRAGLIPLSALPILYIINNNKSHTFVILVIESFFYILSVIGRTFQDRFSIDFAASIISLMLENFFELFMNSLSYLTAFSIMHSAYVIDNASGEFGLSDFIYSITPIPTFLWPIDFNTDLWRVDQFRPMGSVAEMFRVSPILAFLYFWLLGRLARNIDTIQNQGFRVLQICLFFLICVVSYQYSLRTVQWLIYLSILVNVIAKIKEQKIR